MDRKITAVLSLAVLTLLLLCRQPVYGAVTSPALTGSYKDQQKKIESLLNGALQNASFETPQENRQKLEKYISEYTSQIASLENEIAQLTSALQGVEKPENLNDNATKMLTNFLGLKQEKELQLVGLRLLLADAKEANKKLTVQIDKEMAANLFTKNDPIWSIKRTNASTVDYSQYQSLILLISCFGLFICLFARHLSRLGSSSEDPKINIITLLAQGFIRYPFFLRLILFVTLAAPLSLLITANITTIRPILLPIASAVFFYIGSNWFTPLFFRRLFGLEINMVLINIFSLSASLLIVAGFGERDTFQVPHYTFFILLLFFMLMLSLVLRSLLIDHCDRLWKFLRPFLFLLFLALACLEIIGYTNFIDFLVDAFSATTGTIIVTALLYDGIELVLAGVISLKNYLFDRFLSNYSLRGAGFETFSVVEIGIKIYLIIVALILIAHQWGISQFSNHDLSRFFFQGIELSGIAIIPARLTLGLLIFALCWPLVDFVKELLDRRWMTRSRFSASSRDSFLTMGGYASYAILIVLVLTVAGVKLTGLTIVIGALSVGIGFGLQNLVNNFISGIILIFERPIKKGDWILVGSTEGYVKKISIRSTIIQTFDRADVIVPNSELISNQVTNMMLNDNCGRLRVSVGVAYGTDTELVQKLLLQCAAAHPQVITDGSVPVPRAWFQQFGDSSLNFDLLVHIREIDMKIQVRSELHMAIDKIFKAHDISIPFPQRDVHLFEQTDT